MQQSSFKSIASYHWKNIRLIATDMDGTLTQGERFDSKLFEILTKLSAAGIDVLITTGRSAGWVQAIATYLPVVGAIAENGGLLFWNHDPQPHLIGEINIDQRGNISFVGAYGQDAEGSNAGAAYIFERDNNGTWRESKKILASDAEAGDEFGYSVAISDNFAIVGSPKKDTGESNASSAYIFESQPIKKILVGNEDSDSPMVIQDKSQLGTMIDGVFSDSGYNLEQLTPGWHHI